MLNETLTKTVEAKTEWVICSATSGVQDLLQPRGLCHSCRVLYNPTDKVDYLTTTPTLEGALRPPCNFMGIKELLVANDLGCN